MGRGTQGPAGSVYLGAIAARDIEAKDKREVRLLLDTNIFLEILLEQENAEESLAFLRKTTEHEFFISDFTIHSIGIILFYKRRYDVFNAFLDDLESLALPILSLQPHEMTFTIDPASQFNLDFDDAYQYTIARQFDLEIVSYDADFDKTTQGRKKPAEI
jgi:predicted nucleic acid-binding protein